MNDVLPVIEKVAADFGQKFGRLWKTIEGYRTEDADAVILCMGSAVGTTRIAVDDLRKQGKKVGMFKLRIFRPLVAETFKKALGKFKVVGILDRVEGISGYVTPLTTEVRAALYDQPVKPMVPSYVYGLGGREFEPEDAVKVFDELLGFAKTGKARDEVAYIGVR
jgi:pyruvate ferredoxin oxidoreductase alpha subunit